MRAVFGLGIVWPAGGQVGVEPPAHWLSYYRLAPWQAWFDLDADGFTVSEEFAFGTDPHDPFSRPEFGIEWRDGEVALTIHAVPGVAYEFENSGGLTDWGSLTMVPAGPEEWIEVLVEADPETPAQFFRLANVTHPDSDGDCLLDFEELTIYHTDPLNRDSDGDGLSDGDEVKIYRSDPNRGSPGGRGAIAGRVVHDEDGDPATRDHPGIAGWTVFLDLDLDGRLGSFEPRIETGADGTYRFEEVDAGLYRICAGIQPGWTQVFPALTPVVSPDGYADRVVSFTDSGLGSLAGPYGKKADPLPGLRIVTGLQPEPVAVEAVIGPPPPPPISAPAGAYAHVDWLSLPQDSEIVVAFDGEEIVDGPGPDLVILGEGQGQERAELFLGATENDLIPAGTIGAEQSILIDLSDHPDVPRPVRFIKIRALDLIGSFPGFELVGFEALNFEPRRRGHYDLEVVAGNTTDGIDFGVAGSDRPPRIHVSVDNPQPRAGAVVNVQVIAGDDFGVVAATLTANGVPAVLDGEGKAAVPVAYGGLLELSATATDSAGQSAETLLTLLARHADGSLPDLSGYGIPGAGDPGAPSIRVLSPAPGEVFELPTALVGTIAGTGTAVASWQLHYAPANLVNPEALSDDDPDYVLLAEGVGPVTRETLGTLPADTLPPGAYLLRVSASDANGITSFQGLVVGVRVDPLVIRPEVVITSPDSEAAVTYLTEIRGSVRSQQPLREWSVEYARLAEVDLQNLAGAGPSWTRIAEGQNTVEDGVLATFDPTLLPNDSYVLRVSVWNTLGLGWAEPLVLHLSGQAKLGNFAVEFTDLEIPLAGIPIVVRRVYDSLNAERKGDFGYGWCLTLQDAEIAETIPQTGSGFGSTPFRVGTRVYLNAPDGKRIGFTFNPEIAQQSFLGPAWRAVFTPDPGVPYELEVPEGDTPFLSIAATGEAGLFFITLPWNPNEYILEDRQGLRYRYEQTAGLVQIEDLSGNRVTFSEAAIQHSSGPSIQIVRDAQGRVTQIIEPAGRSTAYQYDAQGDLIAVHYPESIDASFAYAAARPHYLDTIHDPLKLPSQWVEYGEDGRVAAIVDAAGNRREQAWDPGSFTGNLTDARGNVTAIVYDQRGNVLQETSPLGGVTTYEYADPLNPDKETAVTDPNGNTTHYTYDERGNLIRFDRPLSRHTTSYTYDGGNRVTSILYATGGRENFEYDSHGKLTAIHSPAGDRAYRYTANGLLSTIDEGTGGVTRYEYDDGFRGPTRVVHPDGTVEHYEYDSRGLVTRYTDAAGAVTRLEYDGLGRVTRLIDPLGSEITAAYDAGFPDQLASLVNRLGHSTTYAYEPGGAVASVTKPGGATTRFEYDANGNRTAVMDPLGNRTEYEYDALNRLIQERDAGGNVRTYQYDGAGNHIESVDGNGRKRTFVYDALNRRTEEKWHDPTDDSVLRTVRFTYDRLDRVTEVTDPDATVKESWWPVPSDLRQTTRTTYPGRSERLVTYDYDNAGRRTQWSLFGELQVRLTRDLNGSLRILTADRDQETRWRVELWRNSRGDVAELRRFSDLAGAAPVGLNTVFTVDPRGWLNRIEHRDGAGQEIPGKTLAFTRGADGRIDEVQDGAASKAFSYDATGQLTGVTLNGSSVENYSYDLNGNRQSSHRHPSYRTGTGNQLMQAGAWALEYDGEGNIVEKSDGTTSWTYQYDHRNRLIAVSKTVGEGPTMIVAEYQYDARNRRIATVHDGLTTWSYFDGDNPIADYLDAETSPSALYVHGERIDELLSVWRPEGGVFWTLTDHLGSIRHIVDASGSDSANLTYDGYGNILSVSGPGPEAAGRVAFTGREWDPESALYYVRARYYDADLGRFLSRDPIGFEAGDSNRYRYVGNRPTQYTDPYGLQEAAETGLLSRIQAAAQPALCAALGAGAGALLTVVLEGLGASAGVSQTAGLVASIAATSSCIKLSAPKSPQAPKAPRHQPSPEELKRRRELLKKIEDVVARPRKPADPEITAAMQRDIRWLEGLPSIPGTLSNF